MYDCIIFTDMTETVLVYKTIGAFKCAYELRKNGHTCLVVDYLHDFSMDEFKRVIDSAMSDKTVMIGFSTTFMLDTSGDQDDTNIVYKPLTDNIFFPQGKEFENTAISYIKQKNAKCAIGVGGVKVHPNYNNKNADFVFLGFSETSIVNVVAYLKNEQPIEHSHKNIWGVTVVDDKTANKYDFSNSKFEWEETDVVNAKVLPIEIARGCIFKCKFCSYPLIGKKKLDFIKSSDALYEELQTSYDKFGVKNFFIIDDTFNDSEYKLDAVLNAVKRLNYQPYFWAYTRLDLIARDMQLFDKLYQIGVRSFYFGIETIDNTAGKLIGKGYDKEKLVNAIKQIRSSYPDVLLHGSFIIGLPEETLESCQSTFDRIMSQDIPLHSFNFKGLQLYSDDKVSWNSELSIKYKDYGYEAIEETSLTGRIDFNWKNQYTSRDEASSLAKKFNNESLQSDLFHIPGQAVWGMMNFNKDYEELSKVKYNNVDWGYMYNSKRQFTKDYKTKLFSILESVKETKNENSIF